MTDFRFSCEDHLSISAFSFLVVAIRELDKSKGGDGKGLRGLDSKKHSVEIVNGIMFCQGVRHVGPRFAAPLPPFVRTTSTGIGILGHGETLMVSRLIFQAIGHPYRRSVSNSAVDGASADSKVCVTYHATITPQKMNVGDEERIYFKQDRFFREYFNELLKQYKLNGLVFDGGKQMWYMKARQATDEVEKALYEALQTININLNPFPGPETFEEALETILTGSLRTAASIDKDETGAFFIVCSDITNKDATKLQEIVENDLSGVTDCIDYEVNVGEMRELTVKTYQTYDVWLVAEFLEKASDYVSKKNVFISQKAKEAVDLRWEEKSLKRQPIKEVDEIRNRNVPLHPHQYEGVKFLLENNGRGLVSITIGLLLKNTK